MAVLKTKITLIIAVKLSIERNYRRTMECIGARQFGATIGFIVGIGVLALVTYIAGGPSLCAAVLVVGTFGDTTLSVTTAIGMIAADTKCYAFLCSPLSWGHSHQLITTGSIISITTHYNLCFNHKFLNKCLQDP